MTPVSCATVAPLNVRRFVLLLGSRCLLDTFFSLESPIIILLRQIGGEGVLAWGAERVDCCQGRQCVQGMETPRDPYRGKVYRHRKVEVAEWRGRGGGGVSAIFVFILIRMG